MTNTDHIKPATTHTLGPWRCKPYWTNRSHTEAPNGIHVFDGDSRLVADVQYEANARLITAAPELLKPIERLVYDASGNQDNPMIRHKTFATIEQARSIIAKATGRQS
jgi:hypothetical protein